MALLDNPLLDGSSSRGLRCSTASLEQSVLTHALEYLAYMCRKVAFQVCHRGAAVLGQRAILQPCLSAGYAQPFLGQRRCISFLHFIQPFAKPPSSSLLRFGATPGLSKSSLEYSFSTFPVHSFTVRSKYQNSWNSFCCCSAPFSPLRTMQR
ncbi:hypothetical protein K402DRAFT_391216 [Aulographum hederae CBS 113979]|uniref:Uncharacterized protein n=1 Tax=Aulographum hederae CBS 113979 TaxID=1176131 RepID=A0A6G1H7R3_9PEZI|nr:hypothetical protein K402DRAFT_391216 [Aulographum hederae CBS 113979]